MISGQPAALGRHILTMEGRSVELCMAISPIELHTSSLNFSDLDQMLRSQKYFILYSLGKFLFDQVKALYSRYTHEQGHASTVIRPPGVKHLNHTEI